MNHIIMLPPSSNRVNQMIGTFPPHSKIMIEYILLLPNVSLKVLIHLNILLILNP